MTQDSEKQLETIRTLTETFEEIKCDLIGQYQISHLIGSGAYGSVWKATSFYTNGDVAVKRIKNKKNVEYCLKRTLREIKILRHFKHGNIVSLHDVIMSSNESSLYLVLDLMETDLHKIIHSAQPLSIDHVKWFLYQLLRALKYLHSANVVHRDIKPSNLLVNSNCLLKLADFGMARCLNDLEGPRGTDKGDAGTSDASSDILSPASVGSNHSTSVSSNAAAANTGKNGAAKLEATIYVATRWYRSPELILCHAEYTTSIDMWSVGCILAELLLRRPLFPGKTQVNQLNLIISVLGHPRKTFVDKIKSDPIKAYMNTMPKNNRPISLVEKIPNCNSKEALDLIQRLLIWEPSDRLPSELALAHSFISKHHRPAEEPICCKDYDYEFENSLVGVDQLNDAVTVEIQKFAALRKRKLKKEYVSSPFSSEAEKEANKLFPQRNSSLWQEGSKRECMESSEESAALARSKKEHSLEVKAKLRAAILSDEWRSKGKRRTRTGRPKNSKITKKKDSESIVLTSTKRAASSSSKELPSLSKEELGTIAQVKTNNRPIMLKIVTASNGCDGSDKRPNNVLTLSFSSPKTHLVPKQGRFVVPKVTNSKGAAFIPVVSGSNKDGMKTLVHRGGVLKNVTITSKFQPKKVLKPNVVAVPTTNPTPKLFSIPKVVHNESMPSASSNQSSTTSTSNAQILPQHAFRFKAVARQGPALHSQSSNVSNSIVIPGCFTSTGSNAQNLPSITEVYNAPKNPVSNVDGGNVNKTTSMTPSNRSTAVTIPTVSSIPIDHSSYPVSFKTNSIVSTTAGISSVPNKASSMFSNRSGITKVPMSNNVRPVTFQQTPRIQPAPQIRYKPALRVQNSNNHLIPQLASPKMVSASKVPMFIEDDDDDDEQHGPSDMMGNDDVTARMNSNGIHPCLRLPSMALIENGGDAPMVSAITMSQKSSASTVPGIDNEMEDLIHKLSSSSLRNDINPFADFLDIPLSAVLTANEDKPPNDFLSHNPNVIESLQQYTSHGGAFIPEPEVESMVDDRMLMWNDATSCNQSLGLTQENYELVGNDCRSIFNISSAEMQEIENELKKDFSCLDFSLLELDSPT